MTPLTSFLVKYLPMPLVKVVALGVYTLTLIAIIVLIGRNPGVVFYLDIG